MLQSVYLLQSSSGEFRFTSYSCSGGGNERGDDESKRGLAHFNAATNLLDFLCGVLVTCRFGNLGSYTLPSASYFQRGL